MLCYARPSHVCSRCNSFQVCANHINSPDWLEHRAICGDDLHLKIIEAKSSKRVYLVDEDRFIFREEVKPEWEYYPEYRVAGTDLKKLIRDYEARLKPTTSLLPRPTTEADKIYAHRIVFKNNLSLSKCMDKWTPVKIVGSGNQGVVYQVCDEFTCDLAAKIVRAQENSELEMFKKASDAGIAPFLHEGFKCGEYLVLVSELYQGNLYNLLKQLPTVELLEKALDVAFSLIYRLLYELGIAHMDTKACNFLYNSLDDIRLADFGISKYVEENKDRYFQGMLDLFMRSVQNPEGYSCDPNDYDYFDLRSGPEDGIFQTAVRNVLKRHYSEWKINHVIYARGY